MGTTLNWEKLHEQGSRGAAAAIPSNLVKIARNRIWVMTIPEDNCRKIGSNRQLIHQIIGLTELNRSASDEEAAIGLAAQI